MLIVGRGCAGCVAAAFLPPLLLTKDALISGLGVDVAEEGFDGGAELGVLAGDDGFGGVGNFHVRLELGVFEVVALGGAVADDGDAVDQRGVLHGHPVD